jgi:hypothetical protein
MPDYFLRIGVNSFGKSRTSGCSDLEGEDISWRGEGVEVAHPPMSKELKKRWSHFIQRVKP